MVLWQPGPTRIERLGRTLETSTGPSYAVTDVGAAYIKAMGNPEGTQALMCEWLGTRAAEWLGLATFGVAWFVVPEGLLGYHDGSRSLGGPAFAARAEAGEAWNGEREELEKLINPEHMAGVVVLDTWLRNCDRYRPPPGERRNERNVFLSEVGMPKGKFRVMAVDHTHILTCGQELTAKVGRIDTIREDKVYGLFPEASPWVTPTNLMPFVQRLRGFAPGIAQSWFEEMPRQWRPAAQIEEAVVGYFVGRARYVADNLLSMVEKTTGASDDL
jgi:hypothetical protein